MTKGGCASPESDAKKRTTPEPQSSGVDAIFFNQPREVRSRSYRDRSTPAKLGAGALLTINDEQEKSAAD